MRSMIFIAFGLLISHATAARIPGAGPRPGPSISTETFLPTYMGARAREIRAITTAAHRKLAGVTVTVVNPVPEAIVTVIDVPAEVTLTFGDAARGFTTTAVFVRPHPTPEVERREASTTTPKPRTSSSSTITTSSSSSTQKPRPTPKFPDYNPSRPHRCLWDRHVQVGIFWRAFNSVTFCDELEANRHVIRRLEGLKRKAVVDGVKSPVPGSLKWLLTCDWLAGNCLWMDNRFQRPWPAAAWKIAVEGKRGIQEEGIKGTSRRI